MVKDDVRRCGSKLDTHLIAWKQRAIFLDWHLDDPPAIDPGDLSAYRRVRDEIKVKCEELLYKIEHPEEDDRKREGDCAGCWPARAE